ncbi:MAG: hypothetical protein ACREHC_00730 [Candidatus Levyibacteriota bacterium]
MNIYNLEKLSAYNVGYLFLDTSSLIAIVSYLSNFSHVLYKLKENGRALVTIPSVAFEFSRTNNIDSYNTRAKFIKEFISIYPIEKHLDSFTPLIPILHRTNGKLSYTDFLLYCCLYQFHSSILLTENHKDFTPTLLDRELTLTIDRDDETQIRNISVYSFSYSKYNKAAEKILRNK